jgi:phosphoribosylformimino-5-aminoimidazole carboxamide ribotide isomerase
MNVIPAIDLKDGRCVRLLQGQFERETDYGDDPVAIARRYAAAGFDRLHVVDLDGARSGEQRHRDAVAAIIGATGLSVQLGGGIRRHETLSGWLEAGVARCIVGSLAVTDPETVASWLADFGPERIVLAFDVRTGDGAPVPAIHGWTENAAATLWQCLDRYREAGLRHVLCTDVARDGALRGPNEELYREVRARYPDLELQASGGVRDIDDLAALRSLGCAAAVTGRAMLDGRISDTEIGRFLQSA